MVLVQHWTVFVQCSVVGFRELNCMLYNMGHIISVARGESGRIVTEVNPELECRLHAVLLLSGSRLRDRLLKEATQFCADATQSRPFEHLEHAASSNSMPAWNPKLGRRPSSLASH